MLVAGQSVQFGLGNRIASQWLGRVHRLEAAVEPRRVCAQPPVNGSQSVVKRKLGAALVALLDQCADVHWKEAGEISGLLAAFDLLGLMNRESRGDDPQSRSLQTAARTGQGEIER